jgi:hypothetical protein
MDKVQETIFTDYNAPLSESFRIYLCWYYLWLIICTDFSVYMWAWYGSQIIPTYLLYCMSVNPIVICAISEGNLWGVSLVLLKL